MGQIWRAWQRGWYTRGHPQDGHRREKGLGKFLVRSYSLKGRNTVVALGIIVVLILQNMFLESSSAFHLLVLLQHITHFRDTSYML